MPGSSAGIVEARVFAVSDCRARWWFSGSAWCTPNSSSLGQSSCRFGCRQWHSGSFRISPYAKKSAVVHSHWRATAPRVQQIRRLLSDRRRWCSDLPVPVTRRWTQAQLARASYLSSPTSQARRTVLRGRVSPRVVPPLFQALARSCGHVVSCPIWLYGYNIIFSVMFPACLKPGSHMFCIIAEWSVAAPEWLRSIAGRRCPSAVPVADPTVAVL